MLSEAEKQKIVKEKAKAKAKALKEKEKAKAMKEKEKAKAKKDKEKAKAKAKKDKEKAKAKAKKARVKGGNLEDRLALPDDLILPIGDEVLVIVDVDLSKLDGEGYSDMTDTYNDKEFVEAASNIATASLSQESGGCISYRIYKMGHLKYKMFELYKNVDALNDVHLKSTHMTKFRQYKWRVASANSGAFVSTNNDTPGNKHKTEEDFLSAARLYSKVDTKFTGEEIFISTPTPLRYGGFLRKR